MAKKTTKAKKVGPKLPSIIWVYEENDGGEKYLCASYKRDDAADGTETRLVGTYRLVETGEIKVEAVYERKS